LRQKVSVFWFRRDLRLIDNKGLYHALLSEFPVLPVFIFDTAILGKIQQNDDARVSFIYDAIQKLKAELEKQGTSLRVFHSSPADAFSELIGEHDVQAVYANKDYEPYAISRDMEVSALLNKTGAKLLLVKDHVIFEEDEVVKDNGEPYTVFTPYSRKWKQMLDDVHISPVPSEKMVAGYFRTSPYPLPGLNSLGFKKSSIEAPLPVISEQIIKNYAAVRDYPAVAGTSRLGVHLRFGTISIRELVCTAKDISEVFLNELIWREFFSAILWHFPYVENSAFKPKYNYISWRNNEEEFERWCRGETGYPMVDAGMRQLNATGFMHNRVRMVTAGFLVKHLLIDWRWGEAYFAEKLLDYDLASNNGNWQWAAGTGCDAAPWFRIFNPETQQKKFDPKDEYVKKWVPEWGTAGYHAPVVDHRQARERALQAFGKTVRQ
jgi:deoxyribodipyrimidine photo-lyase